MKFDKMVWLVVAIKEAFEQILDEKVTNDELEDIIILLERVVRKSGVDIDNEIF